MTASWPLQWPAGWARTLYPDSSKFGPATAPGEFQRLRTELERMGATNVVISSNFRLRRDGLPYVDQERIKDPGVAAYFVLSGRTQCIPCDRWATPQENARAIAKSVEALRGLDRWGAKAFVDAAFKGFEALPAPSSEWRKILDVHPRSASLSDAESAYRFLAHINHPDKGGAPGKMAELNAAIAAARKELS